jgi:hypothetical protein
LDMASVAWDNHRFLHVWRNDAISKAKKSKNTSIKTRKSFKK